MDYETFIDHLEQHTDLWSREKVEQVAATTLEVLGETLSTPERTWVSKRLPARLGDALTRTWGGQRFDMDEFKDRISHREGLVEDFAGEQAQVVCQVLADDLDKEVVEYLIAHLPAPFPALFQRPV
ncbi:DUF2267 domain-containing protein [Persicimonas caeni]|uniref:DUF2267 domain-containing protein n=1 Tax=Persicimonas caeni TaxID=2292766 RepID=A0A4Y6PVM0_PERCE|nr:DUF2267 domain-containing protein [Persicimonas caeni]QDG52401.1 DUF2267 domain-containing protein [Persicimonas caeni]QED33623.1 DUF2267 domain-containing protein [Persicimonas caeni]